MKISILFQDDKIVLDTSKNIKAKEFFKFIRKKYNIVEEKKLILVGETTTYDENEKEEKVIDAGEVKEGYSQKENSVKTKKAEFILISVEDFEKSKVWENKLVASKEELIMKATGAESMIKVERKKKKTARGNYYGGMIGFDSFLSRRIAPFQSIFYNPFDYPEEEPSDLEEGQSESGVNFLNNPGELVSNPIGVRYRFLGRNRFRDLERRPTTEERLNRPNRAGTESTDLLVSPLLLENTENSERANESVSLNPFSLHYPPVSIRQEDVNQLVNEMGFEETRVRTALRITRNNLNRAVELLLNGPEDVFSSESRFTNAIPLPFTRNINLGAPRDTSNSRASQPASVSSFSNGRLNEIRDRILALRNASREEVLSNRQNLNIEGPSNVSIPSNIQSSDNTSRERNLARNSNIDRSYFNANNSLRRRMTDVNDNNEIPSNNLNSNTQNLNMTSNDFLMTEFINTSNENEENQNILSNGSNNNLQSNVDRRIGSVEDNVLTSQNMQIEEDFSDLFVNNSDLLHSALIVERPSADQNQTDTQNRILDLNHALPDSNNNTYSIFPFEQESSLSNEFRLDVDEELSEDYNHSIQSDEDEDQDNI